MTTTSLPVQTHARVAGVLLLLSMVFGFLGEWYIPGKFIQGDAAATAQRIMSSELLYRFGFAAYLVEAVCDIGLALVFYLILAPVSKPLALASAFFGLIATATYAVAEMFYFAPTLLLSGASYMNAFTPEQVNALVMLSLKMFARSGMIFVGIYGITTIIRGYLIVRSGYLPKFIGILLMIGGAGFVAKNLTLVLAPSYSYNWLLGPMFPAGLALTIWMLVKGVNVARWEAARA